MKPYKVDITCQTQFLFQKLCITLHAIKQFFTTQQTVHFQTILVLTWMDVLNARMVVTQNFVVSYASINVLPHPTPLGHIWGNSGDLTQPKIMSNAT